MRPEDKFRKKELNRELQERSGGRHRNDKKTRVQEIIEDESIEELDFEELTAFVQEEDD